MAGGCALQVCRRFQVCRDMWLAVFSTFSDKIIALSLSLSPSLSLSLPAFRPRDALLSETAWHYCSQCLTPSPLASWYQFYCLVNRDTRALLACPELSLRNLVESGIEPATLRSTGRNFNHTTNCPPIFIDYLRVSVYLFLPTLGG